MENATAAKREINPTLDQALAYRKMELSIFPLKPKSKHPLDGFSWKKHQSQLADHNQIIDWLANEPNRNLAIATGALSGVCVLDVDNLDSLAALQLPETPSVRTGNGMHFYFLQPEWITLKNGPIQGVGDFKTDGGYVVAPPSVHENGSRYTWDVPLSVGFAPLPANILAMVKGKEALTPANDNAVTTNYGRAWFKDAETLANALEGERNNLLNKVACKAGSLIRSGELNETEARDAMIEACKRNGLWREGSDQVQATIRSGIKAGMDNPRYRLEKIEAAPVYTGGGTLISRSFADIELETIDWLWEGMLASKTLSMVAGVPGLGKSQLTLDLASRVSRGGQMPVTGETVEAGDVLLLSIEDIPGAVTKPRLMANGADLKRVHELRSVALEEGGERLINLQQDIAKLEEKIETMGTVRCVIIDPINAYLGKANANNSSEVRQITTPLAALAQKYNILVIAVSHLNKDEGKQAINRISGSTDWSGAARTALLVARDTDDSNARTVTQIKNNMAKDSTAYRFTITDDVIEGKFKTSKVVWDATPLNKSAQEQLTELADGGAAVREAEEYLLARLADGPQSSIELVQDAIASGIKRGTLYRAKDKLVITTVSDSTDKRRSLWKLPAAPVGDADHPPGVKMPW